MSREAVLGAIRDALDSSPVVPEVPRAYARTHGGDVVALFCERAADYRADVIRASAADLPAALADACARRGTRRVATADLPWTVEGVDLVRDDGFSPRELDGFDAALTGCGLAIAETGTIILDGSASSGRRVLTLVPDHHLCVVDARDVVGTVPEAIERLATDRPLTFVSGPSATSDIELERVEGVHGPRMLDIFVVT